MRYGVGGGSVGIRLKGPASLVGSQRWSTGYGRERWAVAMKGEGDSLSVRLRTKALVLSLA